MAILVKALDQRSRSAWDRFVRSECAAASFFHLSGWKSVIEGAYRQRCPFLYAERDGQMVGVLPLVHVRSRLFGDRLVATAFTVGGGVAAIDDAAAMALDAAAADLMTGLKVSSLEYRASDRHAGDSRWHRRDDLYAGFARPIAADESECLGQIPRKQRAVVRKAIAAGVLQDKVADRPDAFFPLYAVSMRRMGTPVFGRRFFDLLMAEFAGQCDCLTVLHGDRPISSVLSFYFRDYVLPYYTGCRPEARALGANDFMYWRLMRRAAAAGCCNFDFGRSKRDSGPYHFKRNWGFEPRPITHEVLLVDGGAAPELNPNNPKFRLFIALWRHLPLWAANRLGPRVMREIG